MTKEEKIEVVQSYLSQCNGTNEYHQYNQAWASALLTDGVLLIAETYGAFWLIDLILSYQTREFKKKYPIEEYPLQYWHLEKNATGGCKVWMDYIEDVPVITQEVEFTDFPEDKLSLKFNAHDRVLTTYQED